MILKKYDLKKLSKEDYVEALENIKYLQDIVVAAEEMLKAGEEIEGLTLVEGRKTRYITPEGEAFLVSKIGEDNYYKIVKKPLTMTELDHKLSKDIVDFLIDKEYIGFKFGNPKVKVL